MIPIWSDLTVLPEGGVIVGRRGNLRCVSLFRNFGDPRLQTSPPVYFYTHPYPGFVPLVLCLEGERTYHGNHSLRSQSVGVEEKGPTT